MIRRELIKRNLINLSLPFEDTVKNSPNFINVTSKTNLLKAGKNVFTFKPNYNYLSERFPIVFEVLDVAGKPLFYESTELLDNDGSNIISIHVYDNTPSGNASIIFVATTKYDLGLKELPQQQVVQNNFRYIHKIEINQFERNDTKIIISTDPTFTAKEISAYVLEEKFDDKKVERKYGTGSFLYSPSSISFFDNPPQFTQDMIGGKIYFPKISENYFPTSSFDIQDNPYSSYILDVNSPSHITLESPLIVSASSGVYSNVSTTITQIERQEYYIEYNKLSDNRVYTQNLKPYAKVEIDNLNTFSGKISKVKVYSKSSAKPDSEYSLVYDDDVYPKNILVDKSGSLIEYPIGIFNNNIVINNAGSNTTSSYFALDYWNVNGINGAPTAQKNTSSMYLPDGVYLTPSVFMSSSQELFFEQTSSVASKFYPNTEYELSFNYHLAEPVNDNREQKIEVYISGSAFVSDTTYGKFIVTVPPANIGRSLVKNYRVPILPNFEGNGVLKFLMRDNASISNVKIQEDVDTGFSPNRLTLYVPIKNDHKNEYLDFKFEFFDHTYNVADKTFYLKSIFFNGSNSYIVGDDNIITGSTFVSSFTSSGIELYSKMKPSASMLTSGSSISSYGYQGVEYANLYPTTNSNFGWSLTTGNPFVSSSYSDTSVQMVNKSGSKFDFRTNPDSFDLSIVGNNSSVLIGSSGSANESYLKWDGEKLRLRSHFISGSITGSALFDYIDMDTGSIVPIWKSGRLFWDNEWDTLSMYTIEPSVKLQIGQENYIKVANNSGVNIPNGSPVRITGATGNFASVVLAQSVIQMTFENKNDIIGVATHDINHGSVGFVTTFGMVNGVNTNAYNEGDLLWVSTTAGAFTSTVPPVPYDKTFVGVVVKKSGNGSIFVSPSQPIHLHDLSTVSSSTYRQGDLLTYDASGSLWKNSSVLSGSYTATGSISITGSLFLNGQPFLTSTGSFTGSFTGSISASALFLPTSITPANILTGSTYFNTTSETLYVYNGRDFTSLNEVGTAGSITITGGSTNDILYFGGTTSQSLDASVSGLDAGAVNLYFGPTTNLRGYRFSWQNDRNVVLYDTGNIALWNTGTATSDYILKRNIKPTRLNGIDTLKKLNVIDFEWKEDTTIYDGGKTHTGFVAQEVELIIPDAVYSPSGSTKLLHKEELVPMLVKSLQEAIERIEILEKKLLDSNN